MLNPVPYSDIVQLTGRSISVERTVEVLTELDLFHDDRPDTFRQWFDHKITALPTPMQDEMRTWLAVLRGEKGRARTRKPETIRNYVLSTLSYLNTWAASCQSLREVTTDDVRAATKGIVGHERSHAMVALKSLFSTLKQQRMIFRNPITRRIARTTANPAVPPPLDDAELAALAQAAQDPERRLLFVLAAIQALRPIQMRQLLLTDINLGERRLTVGAHTRPLDRASYSALVTYLQTRRHRWPISSNPHLLVSQQTAYEDGPVSPCWTKYRWSSLATTLDRIRQDRFVEELIATGPDPLHFMAVFGVSSNTATRYAEAVAAMLSTSMDDDNPD